MNVLILIEFFLETKYALECDGVGARRYKYGWS